MSEELSERLTRIENDMTWVREQMGSLCETVMGNGRLGLAAKVQILWHSRVALVGIIGAVAGTLVGKFF